MAHKTLIYTGSDMRDSSLRCVDLLHSSIRRHNDEENTDFLVVSNKKPTKTIPYDVIVDDESLSSQHAVFLRYSSKIPSGYDYYIYLDSDILFEQPVDELIQESNWIASVAIESSQPMMMSPWHSHHPQMKSIHYPCLNSGQFGFRSVSFLGLVRDEFHPKMMDSSSPTECARHEQSCFNYACSKKWGSLNFSILTDRLSLSPEQDTNRKDKTIFHFAGFSADGMAHKYERMLSFSNKYERKPNAK